LDSAGGVVTARLVGVPAVFISYRVDDEPYGAALLDQALSDEFGPGQIFRASRSIRPGDNFRTELLATLNECTILLAVIGTRWLATSAGGRRRIDDESDWVRREIAVALRRDIRVIPVLVADALMPVESELPVELAGLASCQYLHLHHRNVGYDVAHVVDELRNYLPAAPAPSSEERSDSANATSARVRNKITGNTKTATVVQTGAVYGGINIGCRPPKDG
jgi:hypothetical protein